jgi:hypothetical protein
VVAKWIVRLCGAVLICLAAASCATTRERTESFLFTDPARFQKPVDAWLQSIEVVSGGLPMTSDYAIIEDSLIAMASRYGFRLSVERTDQPYTVSLVVHEHSFTANLSMQYSAMAVLNVTEGASAKDARVVYSAVSKDSIASLYYLNEIGEKLFAGLHSKVDELLAERAKEEKAAAEAAARAAKGSSPAAPQATGSSQ